MGGAAGGGAAAVRLPAGRFGEAEDWRRPEPGCGARMR